MPLITAAVLAYAAGLLTGFGGAFMWTALATAAVVGWGDRQGRNRLALAGLAVAGFAMASGARAAEVRCAEGLATRHRWDVTLESDASPGAFVRARHACGLALRVAVTAGSAPSGGRVALRGEASRHRTGLLVRDARLRVIEPPGALARWRASIGRGIDRAFRADAPLVRALLIADMTELSPTLRDRFAAAGLSHMLSVSGLHVGLIAAAILLLAQIAGAPRRIADALVVGVTALYVLVIGAPLPAVRAAVMLGVVSMSHAIQRPTSPWAVLAVGAAVPLVEPGAVLDVGYQLSVVGMIALVSAGALSTRWAWLGASGWRGTLYRGLAASVAATILTAPLVAATFGRISLVAPLTNLAAVPVMAALQPMLFLAALLLPWPDAARFVADACHPLIAIVDGLASVGARLPGSSIAVVADDLTMALACVAGTTLVIAAASRFPARALVAAAGCLALIAWRPMIPRGATLTEIHVLDVGQGDAIALRTARGRWVLFDAGRAWEGGDEGRRQIVPYLSARGGPLVAFVLSHPHMDHVGGAESTVAALRPAWYYDPAYVGSSAAYRESLLAAQRGGSAWRRVRPGDSLVVDEAVITFLAPDSAWADSLRDPNEASAVARVRIGDVSVLMTGDAESREEEWLVRHQAALLRADILKVAHHGSRTSSTDEFLDAVSPRLAIVSVGAGNMYGHPSTEVMRSLAAHGAITLRTDHLGAIIVRTDGRRIEVDAAGERWDLRRQ